MNPTQRDEGIVKYQAAHNHGSAPKHPLLNELDWVRTHLFDLGLIGTYSDGIGYGNVSILHEKGCIISGTNTGAVKILGPEGYCYVRSFDLQANKVVTEGPTQASSESMTHCAIYQANPQVQCVLHIHNLKLWQKLLDQNYPSTSPSIAYGTPEMAQAMACLVQDLDSSKSLLVMAGHEEGIVAYGPTIGLAFDQIQTVLEQQFFNARGFL